MSYYRWSYSNWYAFWCSSEAEDLNEELLALWWGIGGQVEQNHMRKDLPIPTFEHVDHWLDKTYGSWYNEMSFRDKHEALVAITEFLEDTDRHHAEKIRDRIDSIPDGLHGTERRVEDYEV